MHSLCIHIKFIKPTADEMLGDINNACFSLILNELTFNYKLHDTLKRKVSIYLFRTAVLKKL